MSILIHKLEKIYSGNVPGLKGVDLTIEEGGMFGLLGRNGAGKSTLLRILTTLISPTDGTVTINGLDVRKNKREIRRLIGYLPQNFGVYPELTAYEFLDYMGLLYEMENGRERDAAIRRCLELVHLDDVTDRKLGSFSGGMIQRIGIAQALLNSPRILLVDEPTANLDPEERVKFRNLLSENSEGRTVVISTHIVSDVACTCGTMAILDEGQLRFDGSPSALLQAVEGKVHELTIGRNELEEAKKKYTIISSMCDQAKATIRVIGDIGSRIGREVVPTLEDAYIYKMKEY